MDRPGRIIRIAAAVGIALTSFAIMTFALRQIMAEPRPSVDYVAKLNELALAHQPEGENAWPAYAALLQRAGAADIPGFGAQRSASHLEEQLIGDWHRPELAEQRARFEAARWLLREIDQAAEAPGFYRPMGIMDESNLVPWAEPTAPDGPFPLYEVLQPSLGPMSVFGRMNFVRLRAAAIEGDWDEVLRAVRTNLRLSNHLILCGSTLDLLVSLSVQQQTVEELGMLLMEIEFPVEVCEALRDVFEEEQWPIRPLHTMFEGERLVQLDFIQWCFTDDGTGDGRVVFWSMQRLGSWSAKDLSLPPTLWERCTNLTPASLWFRSRRITEANLHAYFDAVAHSLASAPAAPLRDAAAHEVVDIHSFTRMTLPEIERAMRMVRTALSQHQAIQAMLQLHIHHARTGAWPASLAEAVAPAQATCPTTHAEFMYSRFSPGEDQHGRPYELRLPPGYSWRRGETMNPPRDEPADDD